MIFKEAARGTAAIIPQNPIYLPPASKAKTMNNGWLPSLSPIRRRI